MDKEEELSIRVSVLVAAAAGIVGMVSVHAMPLSTHITADEDLLTSVSSGCGLGVNRGPFDGCIPFYPVYPVYPAYSGIRLKAYSYHRGPAPHSKQRPAQSTQR